VYDDIERKAADIRFQMYVKRAHQHHHQHHHSISLGTPSVVGGRISPSPTHGASNPVVLQAPVVQHIRAASCRGIAGGGAGCGSVQSTALGGGVARNEPHPLARLAAATDRDVDDDATTTRSMEASLRDPSVISRVVSAKTLLSSSLPLLHLFSLSPLMLFVRVEHLCFELLVVWLSDANRRYALLLE